jgi:23S rRNA (cytosine1962-C5)-methyltransferase
MFTPDQYQLLDFGQHQKLEQFGGAVVSRTTPSAPGRKQLPAAWHEADSIYDDDQKQNQRWSGAAPNPWAIQFGNTRLRFELRQTPSGQVGVFPEQATNWDWIQNSHLDLDSCTALNLFAYTGGTTMALADRGVKVTHVDAASSVVKWARGNAELSGLRDHPIRWIAEDAVRFVQREIKRGNRYDILIADPPSFGRGPKGETWKLERDIDNLMLGLAELLSDRPTMLIFSSHTPGFEDQAWRRTVERHLALPAGHSESLSLFLDARSGQRLPSGHCFRWTR